ncbi:MAG: selenium cofactor biosynthesis protein YqeC [Pseudoflavonifractor sp.]
MELWKALGLNMEEQRLVTLVGGGGKTTCMYALAHEARQAGKTVIVTTTTHIVPHPALFLTDETDEALLGQMVAEYGIVTVGRLNSKEKMVGADNLPACKAAADIVLAEGDGARVHPLKAPADHEPVIPPHGDAVIAVAGMDALGQPIGEICHRPERVAALLGQPMEHLITPADVAQILSSARGGRKNVPNGIPFCCILNKTDTEGRKNQAELIAALLEREGIPTVMTSFTEEERGGLCWF